MPGTASRGKQVRPQRRAAERAAADASREIRLNLRCVSSRGSRPAIMIARVWSCRLVTAFGPEAVAVPSPDRAEIVTASYD